LTLIRPVFNMRFTSVPEYVPNADRQFLTILSANLWHDWPRRRRLPDRLEAFARLVESEGADVVLLQEVARWPELHVDEWLAERLGMAFAYSATNGNKSSIGFEEGLAVFSRYPMSSPMPIPLGNQNGFVRRMALASEVHSEFGELLAISVHLGLINGRNKLQWRDLQSWVMDFAGGRTALIGGDFNIPEDSQQIRQAQNIWVDTFRKLNPFADGATHELRWPWGKVFRRHRLDYIFLQPGPAKFEVVESRHVGSARRPHSDHRAVVARLSPIETT
jgi:endonuclease/exonuclease/phosphatase family metal-dependent hydrolase